MSELTDIVASPDRVMWKGKPLDLEGLDFNDAAEIHRAIGHSALLDPSNGEHQRLMLWLVLRKVDERLTKEQKESQSYVMTEAEAGRFLTIREASSPEGAIFLRKVYELCGFTIPEDEAETEADAGNEPAAETPPKTKSTRKTRTV